jgi:hypothetical protein
MLDKYLMRYYNDFIESGMVPFLPKPSQGRSKK